MKNFHFDDKYNYFVILVFFLTSTERIKLKFNSSSKFKLLVPILPVGIKFEKQNSFFVDHVPNSCVFFTPERVSLTSRSLLAIDYHVKEFIDMVLLRFVPIVFIANDMV